MMARKNKSDEIIQENNKNEVNILDNAKNEIRKPKYFYSKKEMSII